MTVSYLMWQNMERQAKNWGEVQGKYNERLISRYTVECLFSMVNNLYSPRSEQIKPCYVVYTYDKIDNEGKKYPAYSMIRRDKLLWEQGQYRIIGTDTVIAWKQVIVHVGQFQYEDTDTAV